MAPIQRGGDEAPNAGAFSSFEVRLIAVLREIKSAKLFHILDETDASSALQILHQIVPEIEQLEKDYSAAELKAFLKGFIRGIAGATGGSASPVLSSEETQYTGGHTGGVAVGQGTDPRYVTQSGVHE